MQPAQLNQRAQQIGDFVRGDIFKFVIGGSLIALAVLMLIGSFAFTWVADDTSDESASAMTIWLGGNDDVKTLDMELTFEEDEEDIGGFGDVRLLDRLLILLPLAALALVAVAAAYMFLLKNLPWLTPSRALVAMTILGCFLLLFPLIWESLSVNNWKNADIDFVSSTQMSLFAQQLNSTSEQQVLGFLAFAIALSGLVLYTLSEQGALGKPKSAPSSGMPYQAPPQARPMPPRPGQPEASIPSPQPPPPPGQSS